MPGGRHEGRAVRVKGLKRWKAELRMGRCPHSTDPDCGCALHRDLTRPEGRDGWYAAFGLDPRDDFVLAPDEAKEPSSSDPAPKPERGRDGRPVTWAHRLLSIYLTATILGMAFLTPALLGMPPEFPRVKWSEGMSEDESAKAGTRVLREIDGALPAASTWMLLPRDEWFGYLWTVLSPPGEWARRQRTVEERVGEFNALVADLSEEYERSAMLMACIFTAGLGCALFAIFRPGLGSAILVLLAPLSSTSIATDALLGWENPDLLLVSLPMIVPGSGLLAIRIVQRARLGTAGPRGDHWALVWEGLLLLILGGAITTGGVIWAAESAAGAALYTAVGPMIYGLWRMATGLRGLLRSRRGGMR
jgi:hypothetical protein